MATKKTTKNLEAKASRPLYAFQTPMLELRAPLPAFDKDFAASRLMLHEVSEAVKQVFARHGVKVGNIVSQLKNDIIVGS